MPPARSWTLHLIIVFHITAASGLDTLMKLDYSDMAFFILIKAFQLIKFCPSTGLKSNSICYLTMLAANFKWLSLVLHFCEINMISRYSMKVKLYSHRHQIKNHREHLIILKYVSQAWKPWPASRKRKLTLKLKKYRIRSKMNLKKYLKSWSVFVWWIISNNLFSTCELRSIKITREIDGLL